jgi:hypothetical protein
MKHNALFTPVLAFLLAAMLPGIRPLHASDAPPPDDLAAPRGGEKAYLSIPAAAFTPYEDSYEYFKYGCCLAHLASPMGGTANGWYLAAVHLPQGAWVTRFTFYWTDDSTQTALAKLQRSRMGQGDYQEMAAAESISGGWGSTDDDTIAYAAIDNSKYSYWVVLDLPVSGDHPITPEIAAEFVVIEYTPPPLSDGFLSLPAAAFRPFEDGYGFEDHGRYLYHFNTAAGDHSNGWYLAPVLLPHGAHLNKMTFYWRDDDSSAAGVARLQRTFHGVGGAGNFEELATAFSQDIPGSVGSSADDTIADTYVDDIHYAYWVVLDLPPSHRMGSEVRADGVVLSYTPPPAADYGIISIPAAAFSPTDQDQAYENHGRYLKNMTSGAFDSYVAPLYLPDRAVIIAVGWHFKDNWAARSGWLHLEQSKECYFSADMAGGETVDTPGNGWSSVDTTSLVPVYVDNQHLGYFLDWTLPGPGQAGHEVLGGTVTVSYHLLDEEVYLPLVVRK